MAVKPLGQAQLDEAAVKTDRRKCRKYDQCGVGELAVYLPSKMAPRKFYVPFSALERVYKRVAVSPGSGKAFMTPVLYVVFQYDNGQEKAVYFKYLNEADNLFNDLEKNHPDLPLISESKEQKKREKEEAEEQIRTRELPREIQAQVSELERAKELLSLRPKLYNDLASSATFKRRNDNIRKEYQILAGAIALGGVVVLTIGLIGRLSGMDWMVSLPMILLGAAMIFLMLQSGILPTPKKNKKRANKIYDDALEAMTRSLRKADDFPLPACYAHPYVCDRCIRIIRMDRAKTVREALKVLKEELKAMDSSVSLSGEEYKQIVTIKPMFLVQNYA